MFFLAATLTGWIGGDFIYKKVAAKNIFLLFFGFSGVAKNRP